MRRVLRAGLLGILLSLAILPQQLAEAVSEQDRHSPIARTESEQRILNTINEAVRAGELYANVPAADGRILRLLQRP